MKHQVLFSLKDKSKKNENKSVICCSFAWRFKGANLLRTLDMREYLQT